MKDKSCEICGFEGGVQSHHIIKRRIGGSDDEDNLVLLCPNHHWIADFGTEEERFRILGLIKNIIGKSGKEIEQSEKEVLDLKIRALEEEYLCGVPFPASISGVYDKSFSIAEWVEHRKTWNYSTRLQHLLGRGCSAIDSGRLHKRAEILLLIRKLKEELKNA